MLYAYCIGVKLKLSFENNLRRLRQKNSQNLCIVYQSYMVQQGQSDTNN